MRQFRVVMIAWVSFSIQPQSRLGAASAAWFGLRDESDVHCKDHFYPLSYAVSLASLAVELNIRSFVGGRLLSPLPILCPEDDVLAIILCHLSESGHGFKGLNRTGLRAASLDRFT